MWLPQKRSLFPLNPLERELSELNLITPHKHGFRNEGEVLN